jgi:radical SAM superfamily enzyme YgiQ (UPF0313 family)
MERGVTVAAVQRSVKLAQRFGMEVGMFLMWGYEGEELEDIAATVEHVKQSNPDIFFTTVAYPIKGTPYFESVQGKVELPIPWAEATDRDYRITDRRDKSYYKLADTWLRSEVEAFRLAPTVAARSADLMATARKARDEMSRASGT